MNIKAKGTSSDLNQKSFNKLLATRFSGFVIILGLILFLPAWTLNYWQAWIYLLILSVPMIFVVRYLYKHDPKLLERRMRMKKRLKIQRFIQILIWPIFYWRLLYLGLTTDFIGRMCG